MHTAQLHTAQPADEDVYVTVHRPDSFQKPRGSVRFLKFAVPLLARDMSEAEKAAEKTDAPGSGGRRERWKGRRGRRGRRTDARRSPGSRFRGQGSGCGV